MRVTRLQDKGILRKISSAKVPNLTALLNIKKILTTMLPQNSTTDVMTPVIRIIYNDVITAKMANKKNCLNTILVDKECQKTQLIIKIRSHKKLLCE